MPLPASLVASIISAIIEAAAQSVGSPSPDPAQYEIYATTRTLPPEAKVGVMLRPKGDGLVVIDGQTMPLTATAQFRSPRNLIVMSMSIQDTKDVVYVNNAAGAVHRVWLLNPAELAALQQN